MAFNVSQESYISFRNLIGERTSSVIIWVGSGLSVPAGLPDWASLKSSLVHALRNKAFDLKREDRSEMEAIAAKVDSERNGWIAFGIAKRFLGSTTYRDCIRDSLRSAQTATIPEAYKQVWRLRVRGVLTLNLDRMATRAFTECFPGVAPVEFSGAQVARFTRVLGGARRFIGNLHGNVDDTSTWVLTIEELSSLFRDEAYKSFLRSCLFSNIVLFVGITADDIAVGGHLETLAHLGVETASHYWLTDRRDAATDSWAEKTGIRIIRYRSVDGDHSEMSGFFQDLSNFMPVEPVDPPPPVALRQSLPKTELPSPQELAKVDAEQIRWALNLRAVEILKDETEEQYEEYNKFCQLYDEAVYRAWYTSTEPGRNLLLGYRLEESVARGAFGRVFRAKKPGGIQVAVKVLLEEIRDNPDLLKAFRRGVRSMRILAKHEVEGMVAYTEASEIPAFVVMEWIEGPNLAQAKQAGMIADWATILRIGIELTRIIRRAHALPERVLHRDIRPANIMLANYYVEPDNWKVVVLDFDLSWHRGAQEKSVVHTSSTGYLAPEQLEPTPNASTRNAAVDSFGIGMTLMFMCRGRDPLPDEHRHREWEENIRRATEAISSPSWRSLPRRFARLICWATRDRQSQRWDLSQIVSELERISAAFSSQDDVFSAELVAEEVAARSRTVQGYEWHQDIAVASKRLPSGVQLDIRGDETNEQIEFTISWGRMGHEDRKKVGKYVAPASRNVAAHLEIKGWKVVERQAAADSIRIKVTLPLDRAIADIDGLAATIDIAADKLRFE